jgi:hypothetical protein
MFHEIVGETPSDYRLGHGPIVAPNCVQMVATRPRFAAGVDGAAGTDGSAPQSSSSGEAATTAAPYREVVSTPTR